MPLAVLLNWHLPRRRRLLLAMVALLAEVSRWMRLDLARTPVDWLLLAALMVVVVAYPRTPGNSPSAAGDSVLAEATSKR